MIFKKLPLHYRLKCKEVCLRWYTLLMTRRIFRLDRHIYLNKCAIEPGLPPMSIFMQASYPYDILTLANGCHSIPFTRNLKETLDFWRHLGQSITDIRFDSSIDPEMYGILYEMPQIKVLRFKNSLDRVTVGIICMYLTQFKPLLPNLKMLIATSCVIGPSKLTLKQAAALRKIFPENIKIKVVGTGAVGGMQVEEILPVLQSVQANMMIVQVDEGPNDISKSLLATETLPFQCMKLIYPKASAEPSFDFLKAFLAKHPNVNSVYLECMYVSIPSTLTQITGIKITKDNLKNPLRSMKVLEPLVNLKSIEIYFPEDENCIFGHETVNLPKLCVLSIVGMNLKCMDCVTALTSSFPYLSKFEVFQLVFDDYQKVLEMLFKGWRYLKEALLFCGINLQSLGKAFENFGEQRMYLRSLQIISTDVFKISGDDLLKMGKVFPHLNTLSINYDGATGDLEDIVKGIIPAFKELTKLGIGASNHEGPIRKDTAISVLNHIEKYGQSLRVRKDIKKFENDYG